MTRAATVGLIAIVGLAAGCPTPTPPNGTIRCSAQLQCPRGYDCADDSRCYLLGMRPDLASATDLAGGDLAGADLAASRDLLCEQLCMCLNTSCDGKGDSPPGADANLVTCVMGCVANMTQDLSCRRDHCQLVASGLGDVHCFHARGKPAPGPTDFVCQ